MAPETPSTVTTAAGSIYRKSDPAKTAIPLKGLLNAGTKGNKKGKVKSLLEETRIKHQRQEIEPPLESESEDEKPTQTEKQAKEFSRPLTQG